jgi:hypothetical protein
MLKTCTDRKVYNLLESIFTMVDEIQEACDVSVGTLNELLIYEKLEG